MNKITKLLRIMIIFSLAALLLVACNKDNNGNKVKDPDLSIITTDLIIDDNNQLTGYNKDSTVIVLPDNVTSIAEGLFRASKITHFVGNGLTQIDPDMFFECSQLYLVRAKNAVSIGNNAFSGCLPLEIIDLPKISFIGEKAFFNCNLSVIDFEFAVEVKNQAFASNTNLTTANLPNVEDETFGAAVFANCKKLSSVKLPKLTIIPNSTFSGCVALQSFDFASIIDIGPNSFNRTALVTLSLPNIKTVGNYAFSDSKLNSVSLPNLTSIGKSAFSGCASLTSVNLPKLITVSSELFKGCVSLTSISLPDTTKIMDKAFQQTSLSEFDFTNIIEIGADAFNSTKLVSVNAPLLTTIDNSVFQNCSQLTTINLPLVTSVKMQAFSNCGVLKDISIPNLTSTGIAAFEYCISLESINFPKLNSLGDSTFANCTNLSDADLTALKSIGSMAFLNCTALESFDFKGVTEIKASSFSGSGLKSATLNVVTVSASAFADCSNLQSISLPLATEVLDNAFINCVNLTVVDAPNLVKAGNFVFSRCLSLQTVSLPKLTTVGTNLFEYCSKLNNVDLESLTKLNDYMFYFCTNLNSFSFDKITDNVSGYARGEFAFANSGMISADFSNSSMTEIPFGFFSSSKLASVNFGGKIKTLGGQAFVNCRGLTAINLTGVTTLGSRNSGNVFAGCTGVSTIIIPTTIVRMYGNSQFGGWRNTQIIFVRFNQANIPANWSDWLTNCNAVVTYGYAGN